MSVLVTGGAGFLGGHLCRALHARGSDVVALDRPGAPAADLGDGTAYVPGEVTDGPALRDLMREHRVTRVVHAASIVGVAASAGDPAPALRVNILGAVAVFEAAAELGVRRVVDISSEEYYGDFTEDPIREDAPSAPVSPYGISKAAAERMGGYYARTRGLPYAAVRLCWVYGPGFPRARLPQPWLEDVRAGRNSVLERGGDQRIDFTYVDDAVRGVLAVLQADDLPHPAYNIATGRAVTLTDLAATMHTLWPRWHAEVGPGRLDLSPGVQAAHKGALCIDRARSTLGYHPEVSLAEGLRRTAAALGVPAPTTGASG